MQNILFRFLLPLAVVLPSMATGGPIEDLPPGHWLEVPNSYLNGVAPCGDGRNQGDNPTCDPSKGDIPSDFWSSIQGVLGVNGVIQSWSGGVVDTLRNRLVVWGGGHRDYGGNEIYAFELDRIGSGDNPWVRLTDPTPYPNRCDDSTQCQLQLNNGDNIGDRSCLTSDADTFDAPISRHTYGGMTYIPSMDSMFVLGGAKHCEAGGCGASEPWMFNFTDGRWHKLAPTGNTPRTSCEDNTVYDVVGNKVYHHSSEWSEMTIDPSADTYTINNTDDFGSARTGKKTMLMVQSRRVILQFGQGEAHYMDLNEANPEFKTMNISGGGAIIGDSNPGLAFDTASGLVFGWSGGSSIYSLALPDDLSSAVSWVQHSTAGDTPPSTSDVDNISGGMYGRFQYVPNLNVFVVATEADKNVFIYRHTADGASDIEPPSKPLGINAELNE